MTKITMQMQDHHRITFEVGLIANSWAIIEMNANECIWALAGVQQGLGACMTSQILNITNRLSALVSLMKLRGVNSKLMDEINKIIADIRSPQEKRNRAVHDPWVVNAINGETARVEVTANRKLVFEFKRVSYEEIKKDRVEIEAFAKRFVIFRDAIFASLPTLPSIPELKLEPILFADQPREQNRPNGKK